MSSRITQNAIHGSFNTDIQSIYARMAKSQQQVTDGRKITKPSDDPFGASQVMGFDTQLADIGQYKSNVSDSISFMNSADTALDGVTSALQAIREKATQAANGTNGFQDLQSIASEVIQLKEVVRDAMNTQYGDQYIFSGTGGSTPPFPGGSNLYAGTPNTISRLVGRGQSVQINVPGTSVMGPNGANTLDAIDQLVLDIQSNNVAGIQTGLGTIINQTNQALDMRTQLGATTARLEVTQDRLGAMEERLTSARSDVADVDMAEAYSKFTQQQTMYQAALAAGTRMMQTSILDFL
jgi:flagellar hook-associated protein 3 FlgL